MTVLRRTDGSLELQGECPSEDAEILLRHLLETPKAAVDWRHCDAAHTAVIQVLLAAGVTPRGPSDGTFLRQMVEPSMKAV